MTGSTSITPASGLDWLTTLQRLTGERKPTVLVTILSAQGSTPRAAGTRMVVTGDAFYGTIGGGHLEYRCLELARELLAEKPERRVRRRERFPLGPALGQCCGGAAEVLFEAITAEDVSAITRNESQPALLVTPLAAEDGAMRLRAPLEGETAVAPPKIALEEGREVLIEPFAGLRPPLYLFGAGHVGHAMVSALAPLPFDVIWVDNRAEIFPADHPGNVRVVVAETPRLEVDGAAPGALYLVMTHSHQLDLEICEQILLRGDFAYLGLIGSETKRARFVRRLRIKGVTRKDVDRMTCPIGIPGISGKHPAEIAASVSAQLLVAWERFSAAQRGDQEAVPGVEGKSLLRGM